MMQNVGASIGCECEVFRGIQAMADYPSIVGGKAAAELDWARQALGHQRTAIKGKSSMMFVLVWHEEFEEQKQCSETLKHQQL